MQSIYHVLLVSEFIITPVILALLFFITAPYGRHFTRGWGAAMPAKWAWMFMEFPAFFVILIYFISGRGYLSVVAVIMILIWELHYFQRTFVYPFLIENGKKEFPIAVASMGFFFNLINGFINGWYLFGAGARYEMTWLADPRFIAGAVIFIAGLVVNMQSDSILRELRRKNKKDYTIPRKGLFQWVSCPNYLGEIAEWIGWAVMTWSLPGLAFAVFTIANLLPRALSHHRWYRKKFKNYPKDRKAILPGIL